MKQTAGKKVRIEDVAKLAQVSPTAVSFAFNNPHRLSRQTVDRILDAAAELGYSPNPYAQALLTRTIGVIGILTPQSLPAIFANPFFMVFNEGVGQVCEENHLSLLLLSPVTGTLSDAIAKAPIDGLILIGFNEDSPQLDILHRRTLPYVIVDGDTLNAPSINVDDLDGAYQAAKYLLELGHREIACLSFEIDHAASPENRIYGVGERRLKGYQRAFAEYGMTLTAERLIPVSLSIHGGTEAFHQIWHTAPRPTAVLAIADVLAIGVLQAAAELGVRVPQDLSVVGFDDIPQCIWTTPPLTTVRQPMREKGELAAHTLLSLIAGEQVQPSHEVLPTQLIVRNSAMSR